MLMSCLPNMSPTVYYDEAGILRRRWYQGPSAKVLVENADAGERHTTNQDEVREVRNQITQQAKICNMIALCDKLP